MSRRVIRSTHVEALLSRGVSTAERMGKALRVSQTWISRALRESMQMGHVQRIGSTRGACYGLRRRVHGVGTSWPLRRIDRKGVIHQIGILHALASNDFFLERSGEARFALGFDRKGLSRGIPYALAEHRPPYLRESDDDRYLGFLVQRGWDVAGDLILGNEALDMYLARRAHRVPIEEAQREQAYPALAAAALRRHGWPAFTAFVEMYGEPRHALVKFSRSADLLVAEHIALQWLRRSGFEAVESAIHEADGRCFLEVARVDRVGIEGRLGLTSLQALRAEGCVDARTFEQIRVIESFAALIGDTARSMRATRFHDDHAGTLSLAPVSEIAPSRFALSPPRPMARTRDIHRHAVDMASGYWFEVSQDWRISADFRHIAQRCAVL